MAWVSNRCWGFRPSSQSCLTSGVLTHGTVRYSAARCAHLWQQSRTGKRTYKLPQRKVHAAATQQKRGASRKTTEDTEAQGGFPGFEPPPVIPGEGLGLDEDDEGPEDPTSEFDDEDPRAAGGYTPFETLDFSDDDIMHEVTIRVDAPRSKCYQIWLDRLNYLEWFDITQLIFHRNEEHLASMFMFYQWANTPLLELYTTLSRSQIDEDEVILEESIDGMDLVAGVIFADAEEGSGTDVTFRLGYYLPEQLKEFVGPVAIYGDVNDILEESMKKMKAFVEKVDLDKLQASRKADRKGMEDHVTMNEALFHDQHGSEEDIYKAAQETAEEFYDNFEEAMQEQKEEDRRRDAAENAEAAQASSQGKEEEQGGIGQRDAGNKEDWDEEDLTGDEEDPFTDADLTELAPEAIQAQQLRQQAQSSEASTSQPAQLGSAQTQNPGMSSTEQAQAAASEEQAAADMSSMSQQDTGQFDPEQAARVSPEANLSQNAIPADAAPSPAPSDQAQPSGPPPASQQQTAAESGPGLTAYGQRRGRPRKSPLDTDPKPTPKASTPSKGRGRPPKTPSPKAGDTS